MPIIKSSSSLPDQGQLGFSLAHSISTINADSSVLFVDAGMSGPCAMVLEDGLLGDDAVVPDSQEASSMHNDFTLSASTQVEKTETIEDFTETTKDVQEDDDTIETAPTQRSTRKNAAENVKNRKRGLKIVDKSLNDTIEYDSTPSSLVIKAPKRNSDPVKAAQLPNEAQSEVDSDYDGGSLRDGQLGNKGRAKAKAKAKAQPKAKGQVAAIKKTQTTRTTRSNSGSTQLTRPTSDEMNSESENEEIVAKPRKGAKITYTKKGKKPATCKAAKSKAVISDSEGEAARASAISKASAVSRKSAGKSTVKAIDLDSSSAAEESDDAIVIAAQPGKGRSSLNAKKAKSQGNLVEIAVIADSAIEPIEVQAPIASSSRVQVEEEAEENAEIAPIQKKGKGKVTAKAKAAASQKANTKPKVAPAAIVHHNLSEEDEETDTGGDDAEKDEKAAKATKKSQKGKGRIEEGEPEENAEKGIQPDQIQPLVERSPNKPKPSSSKLPSPKKDLPEAAPKKRGLAAIIAKANGALGLIGHRRQGMSKNQKIVSLHNNIQPPKAKPAIPKTKRKRQDSDDDGEEFITPAEAARRKRVKLGLESEDEILVDTRGIRAMDSD